MYVENLMNDVEASLHIWKVESYLQRQYLDTFLQNYITNINKRSALQQVEDIQIRI